MGRSQLGNSLPGNSHWDELCVSQKGSWDSLGSPEDGGDNSILSSNTLFLLVLTQIPQKSFFIPANPTLNAAHDWRAIKTWKIPSPA